MTKTKSLLDGIGNENVTEKYYDDWAINYDQTLKKWNLDKRRTQPRGKQSPHLHSWGCLYTRTTGIWQTVWLEAADKKHLKNVFIVPNVKSSRFEFTPNYSANFDGNLTVDVSFNNKKISTNVFSTKDKKFNIKIKNPKL